MFESKMKHLGQPKFLPCSEEPYLSFLTLTLILFLEAILKKAVMLSARERETCEHSSETTRRLLVKSLNQALVLRANEILRNCLG